MVVESLVTGNSHLSGGGGTVSDGEQSLRRAGTMRVTPRVALCGRRLAGTGPAESSTP